MNISIVAGIISTVLAVYSAVPYIRSVLNGKTIPDRLGWLVFTIMNGMVFFAQLFAGGRSSTLISLAFFTFSLTVFILSFTKGTTKPTNTTISLFFLALVAMGVWAFTRNNNVAIWLTLVIDILGTAIIILKTRRNPGTEDATSWIIGTIAYVFSCIALYGVEFGILYVRPLYGLVCDAALVFAIYYYSTNRQTKTASSKSIKK